ncbi:MAG TPA: hypothetical protein VLH19_04495 [Patescibacteria group bacterium]|nr:hypothetical protein [Patescibacteria group bacterium]
MSNLIAVGVNLGDAVQLKNTFPNAGIGYYSSISVFINLLLPFAFVVAGLIFLFLIIGAGFTIVTSAGDPKKVEGGKNQILTALIGFIIIFAAYWIIQIIETFTGVKIFNSGI